jgi:hypothetical protein
MTALNLTGQERALAEAMARDTNDGSTRLGFYASVLIPVLLFAGYGIAKWDVLAVGLALVALLSFVVWRLARELQTVKTFRSLSQKIVAHERSVAASPP